MKLFKTIILITFLTVANFSCVQDDDYSIPESLGIEENQDLSQLLDQINNGDVDLMTISQVKSFFIDAKVKTYINNENYGLNILVGGEFNGIKHPTLNCDLVKVSFDDNISLACEFNSLKMGYNDESYYLENLNGELFFQFV